MWISANSFSAGSVFSTIEIFLDGTNLSLTHISLLQIIHRFSSSSNQHDLYLYCCETLFLSVSTSFVVSRTDSLFCWSFSEGNWFVLTNYIWLAMNSFLKDFLLQALCAHFSAKSCQSTIWFILLYSWWTFSQASATSIYRLSFWKFPVFIFLLSDDTKQIRQVLRPW